MGSSLKKNQNHKISHFFINIGPYHILRWRPGQTRDTKYTKVQRKKSGLKLRINLANGFRLPWSCFLKWELRRTYYGKKNILISKLLWPDFSILIKASVEKVMNYWARVTARALIMQLPTLIRIFLKLWQLFVLIYSTVQLFQGRKNDLFFAFFFNKDYGLNIGQFFWTVKYRAGRQYFEETLANSIHLLPSFHPSEKVGLVGSFRPQVYGLRQWGAVDQLSEGKAV